MFLGELLELMEFLGVKKRNEQVSLNEQLEQNESEQKEQKEQN